MPKESSIATKGLGGGNEEKNHMQFAILNVTSTDPLISSLF